MGQESCDQERMYRDEVVAVGLLDHLPPKMSGEEARGVVLHVQQEEEAPELES